ncbi:MAG TPA: hypothetical protein VIX42_10770 [Edaphobacter sp.]
MPAKPDISVRQSLLPGPLSLALPLLLFFGGCSVSPLAKHTAEFSIATNAVVDSSESAYRAAVRLHDDEQLSAAVQKYDANQPWDPHSIKHLIDARGLDARTDILDGLKTYAHTLADLTNGEHSESLDAAASSVGANLKKMSAAFNPDSTDPPSGFSITPAQANAASTALKALGDFLASQKVKSGVPKIIRDMDPQIAVLSNLLDSDITILRRQSGDDYEQLLMQQDSFIRKSGHDLSPIERRAEIKKLGQIILRKEATDDMLHQLQITIKSLAETHHALAAAAQSKDSAALSERIAELLATANRLNHFYDSLPTT